MLFSRYIIYFKVKKTYLDKLSCNQSSKVVSSCLIQLGYQYIYVSFKYKVDFSNLNPQFLKDLKYPIILSFYNVVLLLYFRLYPTLILGRSYSLGLRISLTKISSIAFQINVNSNYNLLSLRSIVNPNQNKYYSHNILKGLYSFPLQFQVLIPLHSFLKEIVNKLYNLFKVLYLNMKVYIEAQKSFYFYSVFRLLLVQDLNNFIYRRFLTS